MRRSIVRKVTTPDEYREVIRHAEGLGLDVEATAHGTWIGPRWASGHLDAPAWPKGSEIVDAGNRWFKMDIDGSVIRLEPFRGSAGVDGYVRLELSD